MRQITVRSPIWRIDTLSREGRQYTTARRRLERDEMEQDFLLLSLLSPQGLTEGTAAVETEGGGLTKAAAAQPTHRRMVVRIEQRLQSREAADTYGQPGDQAGRRLAEQQAAAIARLATHAVELAERADWGAGKIHDRLETLVEQTAIERIRVVGRNGATLYSAASEEARASGNQRAHEEPIRALSEQRQGTTPLAGWYNSQRRWVAGAAATRNNGALTVSIELATRTGEGSLIEAAWQIEADRLAQVAGITGVWVVEAGTGEPQLAAAGPRPGREAGGRDAWSRWNEDISKWAERADSNGGLMSELELDILHSEQASVLSAAPTPGGRQTEDRRFLVLMETNADAIVTQMRDATWRSAGWALGLIGIITGITSWMAQRWLTNPIRRIAAAARLLQRGTRPPSHLTGRLRRRRDEIGMLAESFGEMAGEVVSRHEELTARVAERTQTLEDANKALNDTKAQMDREVQLARQVQESLIPSTKEEAGDITLCSRMTPARELCGDFLNLETRDGNELFVTICDVSGKGVAAALFMAVAQAALTAAAERHRKVDAIASAANAMLCRGNTLGMFVTGMIATLDPRTGHIEYVLAGHEAPYITKPGKPIRKLKETDGIPLGLDPEASFNQTEYTLAPSETLIAYTDGVTDACNPDGEMFGEERLADLVAERPGNAPDRVIQTIWNQIGLFCGGIDSTDDKTCLVMQRRAKAPRRRSTEARGRTEATANQTAEPPASGQGAARRRTRQAA